VPYQGVDIDLGSPFRRATMNDLVKDAAGGLDLMGTYLNDPAGARAAALAALETHARDAAGARKAAAKIKAASSTGVILNEMFEALAEASLTQPTFVLEHPVDISPLAKPHRTKPGVTERFELFIVGASRGGERLCRGGCCHIDSYKASSHYQTTPPHQT
jgi:lysyl-tRNA synthetase class 2